MPDSQVDAAETPPPGTENGVDRGPVRASGRSLCGMPHLGSRYDDGRNARLLRNGRRMRKLHYLRDSGVCVVCGEARADQTHHVWPVGAGGAQEGAMMPDGSVAYSPLMALCGTCHAAFHDGTLLAEWVWDTQSSARMWGTGWLIAHGVAPYSDGLFGYGRWRVSVWDAHARGYATLKEFRGGIDG
ncbi:MAG: hypothetical protein FWD72_01765 [Eggerthellaceae bacterium]|nr:hypothetical protein [Eggerthellaceae bacterium]